MNTNAQSTIPARANVDALLETVQRREADIAAFLPEGVNPTRFAMLARRAIQEQPALGECSVNSVLHALRACALSGLELDGQFSSLIVRRPKQGKPIAVWSASYRGLTWQALATGHLKSIEAHVVFAKDEFLVEFGSEPKLVHRPWLAGERGELVASYCVAELTTGGRLVELLTRSDIDRIKAASPAGDRGPWNANAWPDEMAKKAAIRRMLKRLPAGTTSVPAAPRTRVHIDALRHGTQQRAIDPEFANQLECQALAHLSDATSLAELDAAWAQAQLEHQQRGADLPVNVEARWHEMREQFIEREGT